MKKLSKTLLSIAAVSAVSAALAASAMAADLTATPAEDRNSVGIDGIGAHGDQITMLIVKGEAGTAATEANIIAIDQTGDATTLATVPVRTLADGTYEVRIGGTEGEIQTITFNVGGGDTPDPVGEDMMFGNINGDTRINAGDVTALAKYTSKIYDETNATVGATYNVVSGADVATIIVGNINGDARVNAGDVTALAKYTSKIFDETNTLVGTTIKVTLATAE